MFVTSQLPIQTTKITYIFYLHLCPPTLKNDPPPMTSCMSVAVSDFGAEWPFGGNVLCNVLMGCYRYFLYNVPTHNRFISNVEGFTFRILD